MNKTDPLVQYGVRTAVGARSTGKTTYMIGNAKLGITGFAEKYAREYGMTVIFLDTIENRPDYAGFQVVPYKKMHLYKGGAIRVIVNTENKNDVIQAIRAKVRDALIVSEDSRTSVPNNIVSTPWEGLIVDSKNIRCSLFFMYHNWKAVPPMMFTYIDELIIFKTKGRPDTRKNDIINYEEVTEAFERVMAHPSQYHHEIASNG